MYFKRLQLVTVASLLALLAFYSPEENLQTEALSLEIKADTLFWGSDFCLRNGRQSSFGFYLPEGDSVFVSLQLARPINSREGLRMQWKRNTGPDQLSLPSNSKEWVKENRFLDNSGSLIEDTLVVGQSGWWELVFSYEAKRIKEEKDLELSSLEILSKNVKDATATVNFIKGIWYRAESQRYYIAFNCEANDSLNLSFLSENLDKPIDWEQDIMLSPLGTENRVSLPLENGQLGQKLKIHKSSEKDTLLAYQLDIALPPSKRDLRNLNPFQRRNKAYITWQLDIIKAAKAQPRQSISNKRLEPVDAEVAQAEIAELLAKQIQKQQEEARINEEESALKARITNAFGRMENPPIILHAREDLRREAQSCQVRKIPPAPVGKDLLVFWYGVNDMKEAWEEKNNMFLQGNNLLELVGSDIIIRGITGLPLLSYLPNPSLESEKVTFQLKDRQGLIGQKVSFYDLLEQGGKLYKSVKGLREQDMVYLRYQKQDSLQFCFCNPQPKSRIALNYKWKWF